MALGSACLPPAWAASGPTEITVKTPSGALVGEQSGGIRIFRGIPFAAPPVGPQRFRPPERIQPWQSPRPALHFAASAMQPAGFSDEKGVTHSEDCLYLNIWAPKGKGPYPVYLWIHGGGFTFGHSFEAMYDGAELASQGVILVTAAYRLGILGFLDVGPLLGASYEGSANNAVRDLMAALHWIKKNIAAFGGDLERVTVGGESAGAKLTGTLMGVPSAEPLFHQMISESGGAERVGSPEFAHSVAEGFAASWKKETGLATAAMATAPAELLVKTQQQFMAVWPAHFPLRPERDGKLVPHLPVDTIAAGATRGKRLLIGTNRDESAVFIGPHPKHDATAADLGNLSLERFAAIYAKYKQLYPQMDEEERRIRAVTAEEYWVPSMRVAEAHLRGGGKAFLYRLDFAESSGAMKGRAYHSLDLPLVWDRPREEIENARAEAELAKRMTQAWISFLRDGKPAAAGLPQWPEYSLAARRTMILDTVSHVEEHPQEAELRLWNGVL
jgi:para-nitrobenzyl esterase